MNRLLAFGWFLGGAAFCLLILLLIPFQLDPKIDLAELLQLTVTVIIGVLLQLYAVRNYSDFRVTKNLLIERAEGASKSLSEAHKLFTDCYARGEITVSDRRAMLAAKREFSNSVLIFEKAAEECALTLGKFEQVKSLRGQYIDRLTGGGFPAHPYTPQVAGEEGGLYLDLSQALTSLIFEINRK